jgi:phenylalanyl-tRNA synthetase beta chain
MKITINWLRALVEVVLPADELADALVMAGIDVEAVEEHRVSWRSVEVAEIVSVAPHPNADRLRLCEVRTGRETVRVVCGASNMQPGDHVALAPPGTALPDGRQIARATIRGQTSEGMLCSASELALADDDGGGILILPRDAPVGSALVDYLGAEDTVLDLAPTPNRGDCLSVLGIAREIAALTGARLHVPAPHVLEGEPAASTLAQVEVEAPDLCPRYCARLLRGVQVGPTPPWMRTRLALVGLRSINNVVDVTNYVMVERGQPLHAFDLARIAGSRVVVRRAVTREGLVTLDGIERELAHDDLVIADAESAIAVAGVMGGERSEIRPETRDVLLESAFFVPQTVRRTARRLGLATDSSFRFERGVDPAATAAALDRAVELLLECAGGTVARGVLERHARRRPTAPIRLRPARLNALLGTHLGSAEIERPLRALGAEIARGSKTHVRVVPPSHRFDLQVEVDLIEEVARLAGYDTIPATTPAVAIGGPGSGLQRDVEERARAALRAAGLSEMVTLALIASAENRRFPGLPEMAGDPIPLRNPLSADADELRRSLLPGLLHVLEENRRHGESLIGGFSLGRVYARSGSQYHERQALGLLIAGTWPPATVGEAARASAFADIKGALDLLLGRLHLDAVRWETLAGEAPYLHPGKSARITIGSVLCGVAGALHPDLVAESGLAGEVWVAELDMLRVVQYCPRRVNFRVLPRFPAVQRDIAVVVEMDFQAQLVLDAIAASGEPLAEDARIFDQYTGAPIPDGKKSLAYTISYRAADRTLTDEEVNAVHERIVGALLQRLPVEVRR